MKALRGRELAAFFGLSVVTFEPRAARQPRLST